MLGIKKTYLRNELYLQAIKQTINSPSSYTQCRAFHLLCLLSDAFTPSSDFYCYVVNFLLSHTDKLTTSSSSASGAVAVTTPTVSDPSPIQQMASYCLVRLQSLKLLPLDKHLLDIPVETVEAYSARLPTIAPIYTPDGDLLGELLVAPDVGIERLMKIICALLHLHDSRSGVLGLYVTTSKSSDLAPMTLLPDRDFFIGDICQPPLLQKYGRPIRYTVKRKILEPSCLEKFSWGGGSGPEGGGGGGRVVKESRGEREALVDLTFMQMSARVRGEEIRVRDDQMLAHLAALQLATEAQFRPGSVAIALGQGCMNFIPESRREGAGEGGGEGYWGQLVAQELFKCVERSDHQLKEEYVNIVSSLPFGLMQTYVCLRGSQTTLPTRGGGGVPTLPEEIFLGINEAGLHLYDAAASDESSTVPVLVVRFVDIKSVGVKLNSIRFVLEAGDSKGGGSYQIELITPLNEEVSQYCLLYRPVQQLETQFSRLRHVPSTAKTMVSPPPPPSLIFFVQQTSAPSQSRLQKLSTAVS
jgi:hypothetical protein